MSIEDVPNHWKLSEFVKKLVPAILTGVIPLVARKSTDSWDYLYVLLVASAVALGVDTFTFATAKKPKEGE